VGGLLGEVPHLVRIECQVIELLGGDDLIHPARRHESLLAGAVVAVGEHGMLAFVEAADVLPALRPHRTCRFIGRVEGDLGEDLLI
jgi:hypothetical protein